MKRLFTLCMLCLIAAVSVADALDSLRNQLQNHPQIQEKIYIHTDNTCYFIGDTLWYKAYVLRSDNLQYTDMSKILYVELLNPDGLVVERQQVVVSEKGYSAGDFVIQDSLYSGFYELRAYSRWNLNFNVTHRRYNIDDRRKFYNYQLASDFFRQWDGLYSRVIPIYAKPKEEGDYLSKYIFNRPKEDLIKEPSPELHVSFYPEGGNLIRGTRNHIAFEVTDQNGTYVDITGRLDNGTEIKTFYQGKGEFFYTPSAKLGKAIFHWNDKDYTFSLPKVESEGVAVHLENDEFEIAGIGAAAYAITCRGKLYLFERLDGGPKEKIKIDQSKLPTGINEIIVLDRNARPLASRLFFINHHDMSVPLQVTTDKQDYQAYDPVRLSINAGVLTEPTTISVSVHDASIEDASYDNGNMLTDILLSSELKGFVANPAYYFESDDSVHQKALDLLMLVQGWRRYKRVKHLRYAPEYTMTIEGHVYKVPNVAFTEVDEIYDASQTISADETDIAEAMNAASSGGVDSNGNIINGEDEDNSGFGISETETNDEPEGEVPPVERGVNQNRIVKGALVEAEIEKDTQSAGVIVKTDSQGHFMFQIPPFYGNSVLFIKAYPEKDSAKYAMSSRLDKHWTDEQAYPNYYVKRDMFFPIYAKPYSWYQIHQPEINLMSDFYEFHNGAEKGSRLAGDHQLQTVKVVASTRTRRGITYSKPALVMDIYDLYNNVTDYGLSFGIFQANQFPAQAATYLYGNMGMYRTMNIRAMIDGTSFYRNYKYTNQEFDRNQVVTSIFNKMRLNRLQNVKVYSDYEPRNDEGMIFHQNSPSVTFEFEAIPDDGKRYTYRDRRYILTGFELPDEFYSPDYSKSKPTKQKDYRRTLYWNPNVKVGTDGTANITCYNNSRETRVKVSAAGLTKDGKILLYKPVK